MKKHIFIAVFTSLLFVAAPVLADIYMYLDSDGVLHFTNTPTSSHYKLYIKEKPKKVLGDHAPTSRYDHLISEAAYTSGISFALIKATEKKFKSTSPVVPLRLPYRFIRSLFSLRKKNSDQLSGR